MIHFTSNNKSVSSLYPLRDAPKGYNLRLIIMIGYKFKLVYVVTFEGIKSYDVKYGNNKTQLKVFAERNMKTKDFTIIEI